jgi:hypothetical protein
VVLNVVKTDVAYCMYPKATLSHPRRALCLRESDDKLEASLLKYRRRGCVFDFDAATVHLQRLYHVDVARYLGDRYTRRLVLSPHSFSPDSVFEAAANTWLLTHSPRTGDMVCVTSRVNVYSMGLSFVSFRGYLSEEYVYDLPPDPGNPK